jgi:hypothetical protein
MSWCALQLEQYRNRYEDKVQQLEKKLGWRLPYSVELEDRRRNLIDFRHDGGETHCIAGATLQGPGRQRLSMQLAT